MRLTLEVPDAANISQTDAQILFAMKLFEADKLSLGKAAETAGLSYRAFYELLVRYGIPVVTMTEEDVKWEIENALLIIDDRRARQFALGLGLEITGTLGLLIRAYEQNVIQDIDSAVASLREVDFRLPANTEDLIKAIKK
jgi:predicted HTH domain antitoxin